MNDAGSAWPLRMTAAKSRHGHAEAAAGAVGMVALALGLACAAGSPSPSLRQVQAKLCLACFMYVAAFQPRRSGILAQESWCCLDLNSHPACS